MKLQDVEIGKVKRQAVLRTLSGLESAETDTKCEARLDSSSGRERPLTPEDLHTANPPFDKIRVMGQVIGGGMTKATLHGRRC